MPDTFPYTFRNWHLLIFLVKQFFAPNRFAGVSGFNVEFISIMPYNLSIGGALPFTGAALDLALDSVQHIYSYDDLNISVTLLYQKDDYTCADTDSNAPFLLADYYNRKAVNSCVAVMAASCSGLLIVPYLVKEWDVLLFSKYVPQTVFELDHGLHAVPGRCMYDTCLGPSQRAMISTTVINPVSAPTATGMVGSYQGLAVSLLELFRQFKWSHVTVLVDDVSFTDFYLQTMQATKLLAMSQGNGEFFVDSTSFNPASRQSMIQALILARKRSRVFVIEAGTTVVIKLLREVKAAGILNPEEYVFVVMQSVQSGAYGAATLFDTPTKEDEIIFRSVFYLTTFALKGPDTDNFNKILVEREKNDYGTTFEPGIQPLDIYTIPGTYNSLHMFLTLVNESRTAFPFNEFGSDPAVASSICGGRRLKSLMNNRTFDFPRTGAVHVNEDGSRHADLLLFTYHSRLRTMQVAAVYQSVLQQFVWSTNSTVTVDWFTAGVPKDVPNCGFSGTDGICKSKSGSDSVLIPVIVVFVIFAVPVIALLARKIDVLLRRNSVWWQLDINDNFLAWRLVKRSSVI